MSTRRKTRWGTALVGVGIALLAGALVWRIAAAPALIKFPTDVDQTLSYEGTFRLFVDPATASPLAQPRELPLLVERRVTADGDASSAGTVVLDETITVNAEGLPEMVQRFRYVMDRDDAVNRADPRAFAYDEANVVDRSGTWRLALPQNVDQARAYPIYKNETAQAIDARASATEPTSTMDGLSVVHLEATVPPAPVSAAYLAAISEVVPLPASLTVDELRPVLVAAGVDVDALIGALAPALSPAEQQMLAGALTLEVPIDYVDDVYTRDAVERRTGAVVDVETVRERLSAQPDASALSPIAAMLGNYAQIPAVADALVRLSALGDTTIPVYELDYAQTPASVADMVAEVKDQLSAIRLVERWIPLTAAGIGAVLAIAGLTLLLTGRGGRGPAVVTVPVDGRAASRRREQPVG